MATWTNRPLEDYVALMFLRGNMKCDQAAERHICDVHGNVKDVPTIIGAYFEMPRLWTGALKQHLGSEALRLSYWLFSFLHHCIRVRWSFFNDYSRVMLSVYRS